MSAPSLRPPTIWSTPLTGSPLRAPPVPLHHVACAVVWCLRYSYLCRSLDHVSLTCSDRLTDRKWYATRLRTTYVAPLDAVCCALKTVIVKAYLPQGRARSWTYPWRMKWPSRVSGVGCYLVGVVAATLSCPPPSRQTCPPVDGGRGELFFEDFFLWWRVLTAQNAGAGVARRGRGRAVLHGRSSCRSGCFFFLGAFLRVDT